MIIDRSIARFGYRGKSLGTVKIVLIVQKSSSWRNNVRSHGRTHNLSFAKTIRIVRLLIYFFWREPSPFTVGFFRKPENLFTEGITFLNRKKIQKKLQEWFRTFYEKNRCSIQLFETRQYFIRSAKLYAPFCARRTVSRTKQNKNVFYLNSKEMYASSSYQFCLLNQIKTYVYAIFVSPGT